MQYFFVFNQAFYCSKQNIRFPLASRSKQFPLSPPFQAIPSLVLHRQSSPFIPAAKLRNQRLAVKLGIKNKLLLRIRIEKRHVGFHHRQSLASLLKHHPERRKLKINIFPMHLRILNPTIQLAEIHEESLKDAVHPKLILREIKKLQSAILILAGKGRVPNQTADIKNQLIKPAKPMLKEPPQQTFCNTNLLNMRKFC